MSIEASSDVSLEELFDAADDTHLACACRPSLMFCGIYIPGVRSVKLDYSSNDDICTGCLRMWYEVGCICGCRHGAICAACIASSAETEER